MPGGSIITAPSVSWNEFQRMHKVITACICCFCLIFVDSLVCFRVSTVAKLRFELALIRRMSNACALHLLQILWRCYSSQNRKRMGAKSSTLDVFFPESSNALHNLGLTVSNLSQQNHQQELLETPSAACSDGDSTVSEDSDESSLSEGEITIQTQQNSVMLQEYMEESYLHESEICFADGPLAGEPITLVAPPLATLLHFSEEGDVAGPEGLHFQPCSVRDMGLFFDIWVIVSGRCSELGQSKFDPGALMEATCARHATLLLSETCISLLFIVALESERSGRGQFLVDTVHLSVLTWQEHARRLLESKGACVSGDACRGRAEGGEEEGDGMIQEMFAQLSTRDFHLMDADCKVTLLRCLLLACTQPGASVHKMELKNSVGVNDTYDRRPKRRAAQNYMAGLEAIAVSERDGKRKKAGSDICEAIDSSGLSISNTLGRGPPLGIDRHGNRFYHVSTEPGRIFCEGYSKMWWMVYETSSHMSSLLKYLHPSGIEEHLLIQAIVDLERVISRGIAARLPSGAPSTDGKRHWHAISKSRAFSSPVAAHSQSLGLPDWLADAEGNFIARHLMAMSSDLEPTSISAVVAPGVGYSDLRAHSDDSVGMGAVELFGARDTSAAGDTLSDADELLISKHWLPNFLRRRRFSNQVRLYENLLHFSGFRSLCSQAHPVNRLVVSLTGACPTKSCVGELLSAVHSLDGKHEGTHADDIHAAGCPSTTLPVIKGAGISSEPAAICPLATPPAETTEITQQLNALAEQSDQMPGVYNPIVYLKAHSIRLFATLFSVVNPSVEGTAASSFCFNLFQHCPCSGRIFEGMASQDVRCGVMRCCSIISVRARRGSFFLACFLCSDSVFSNFLQYIFCHLRPSQSLQSQGSTLPPCLFAHRIHNSVTTHTGASPPNEAGKRERDTRRGNASNESNSSTAACQREGRIRSHGVWSQAVHRENWRSNLSAGTCPVDIKLSAVALTVFVQHQHAQVSGFTCTCWLQKLPECKCTKT